MQYSEGSLGRIFIFRIDDGKDLLESIQKFVKEKCVESGMMLFLGAMKDGRAVTGPEKPVIPPSSSLRDIPQRLGSFEKRFSILPKSIPHPQVEHITSSRPFSHL